MALEDIRKFINERVKPVDFSQLLREADGDDEPPMEEPSGDVGGFEDAGPDDFEGGFDDASGDSGPGPGPSGSTGEDLEGSGDSGEAEDDDKFRDREDDPDFKRVQPADRSAAETEPSGEALYDVEGVLRAIGSVVDSSDVDLAEIEPTQKILELIANGKKLKEEDFDPIHEYDSFSGIVKKCLEGVDENTRNYFNMKIKRAVLDIQKQKKIDASKAKGDVEQLRGLADKF